ncbi:MAG: ABC transporter ATP-binding protein, partial [Alphaproteobacteria bacterium]
GTVRLFGRALEGASARERVVEGVARIPEDRDAVGLVGELSIWENLIAERYWDREFSRAGLLLRAAATGFARRAIAEYDVRCPGPAAAARQLSGGNKQKLILARTLSRRPGFVVANQPTRGLDVAAVAYVHERLLACRVDGAGVLLISEDLDEILALADRVRPIYRGRLGPEFVAERLSVQELGLMMAGHLPSGIGHAA